VSCTATSSADTILKTVGSLSHVVQASENGQPRNMYITQAKTHGCAYSASRYATSEHGVNAMGDIERMPNQ
jgi:hypothetical protein